MDFISNLIKRPISLVMSDAVGDAAAKENETTCHNDTKESKSIPNSTNSSVSESDDVLINGLLWQGTPGSGSTGNLSLSHYPNNGGPIDKNVEENFENILHSSKSPTTQKKTSVSNCIDIDLLKTLKSGHWADRSEMEKLLIEITDISTPPIISSPSQV